MTINEKKIIELPEICRVEGHSAVTVDIQNGKVKSVQLNVFEGTRFFERIVIGHPYGQIPHITSRVCAICSTGHVIAASKAIEKIFEHKVDELIDLYRKIMHLGMIIESHATHICALALPDFLGTPNVLDFATRFPVEFKIWTNLRNYGAAIQTVIGGRPFHPVNLQVGTLSSYPPKEELKKLLDKADAALQEAVHLCDVLMSIKLPFEETAPCNYLAIKPEGQFYDFFGQEVISSEGFSSSINNYKEYLCEKTVSYSHAKRSQLQGKPFMVGAMARLHLFGTTLGAQAGALYRTSTLSNGNRNTVLNNLAQAIEIVEAIEQVRHFLPHLISTKAQQPNPPNLKVKAGKGVGAVECPRGTLYHFYELDSEGKVIAADMITPSAQNTARIEEDIRVVCEKLFSNNDSKEDSERLQRNLETLVRAYDPCNTCATHMVEIKYA